MKTHFELTDLEFERQFECCQLDPKVFSHEAHLRLAWIHITKYGIDTALSIIQAQIKSFVAHVGAADKYNTTLTIAAVRAVYHFILRSEVDNFRDFIEAFPRLKNNFKGLMNAHYGIDIFKAEIAKKMYLEPDLLPFD